MTTPTPNYRRVKVDIPNEPPTMSIVVDDAGNAWQSYPSGSDEPNAWHTCAPNTSTRTWTQLLFEKRQLRVLVTGKVADPTTP